MKQLNIISFDVPYPPNYGGVIDVFYKLKQLSLAGVEVHLHCFEYGRGQQKELEQYCKTVTYYKRKTGPVSLLSAKPYIVKSRENMTLKMNLLRNDYPILFEGLHTCFLLSDLDFSARIKLVRTHNIEHEYYMQLAKNEPSVFKKNFFKTESKKLQKFEKMLEHANYCLSISEADHNYFNATLKKPANHYIPAFHASDQMNCIEGTGKYVLYHGNLSVGENAEAAAYLIKNVMTDLDVPFKIAGLNPSNSLKSLCANSSTTELIENPSDKELHELIQHAKINYLYTNQTSGLKLKLLNALFNGRHCQVNDFMIHGSGLDLCCHSTNSPSESKAKVLELMKIPFSATDIANREQALSSFSNTINAKKIIDLI